MITASQCLYRDQHPVFGGLHGRAGIRIWYHVASSRMEVLPLKQRQPLTILFPADLLSSMDEIKSDAESIDDFIIDAVEREVRRRQGLPAHEKIVRLHEEMRMENPPNPDSVPLIRELREERSIDRSGTQDDSSPS